MMKMIFAKSSVLNKQSKFVKIDQQQGWTMWSLMFVIAIIALFSYVGLQLVPVYTTNNSITSAMQNSIDEVSPNKVSRQSIIGAMRRRLNLDGNDDFLDYKKDVGIKRTQRELIITVNYERRVPLFYNLSLVAVFENEVKRGL